MSLSVLKKEQYFKIDFEGSLLISSHRMIVDTVLSAVREKSKTCKYIVLDFTNVDLMTSVIVNAIIQNKGVVAQAGLKLVIIAPEKEKFELFELTGFSRIFPTFHSVDEFKNSYNIK